MSLDTPNEVQVVEAGTLPRWVTVLFVVAFALVAYLLYAGYAERQAMHKSEDDAAQKAQATAAELDGEAWFRLGDRDIGVCAEAAGALGVAGGGK